MKKNDVSVRNFGQNFTTTQKKKGYDLQECSQEHKSQIEKNTVTQTMENEENGERGGRESVSLGVLLENDEQGNAR